MRRLLNTLYVTSPDAYLACEGENVLVKIKDETRFRFPIHNLESIITFGYTGASPGLMRLCCDRGVSLCFLSESGRFLGRVTGGVHGNVLLRRAQYRWADSEEKSLRLSKRFITGKILNCRTSLKRSLREHGEVMNDEFVSRVINLLEDRALELQDAVSLERVRGIEGEAAREYFSCFNQMITAQRESFSMHERIRRPPKDNVNAMLSFVYTLLAHDVTAALESVGLDPQVGFLHRDRPGRVSLALDIMEELRPYLADRLVLSLINRKQVEAKGFVKKESGAVIMDEDTRKTVLSEWQKRKQKEIIHPYLEEKIPIGLLPYVQSMLLSRFIRGDMEDYPPFLWK